jgi:hypothetical protein
MSAFQRIAWMAAAISTAGCLVLTSHDEPWPCRSDSDCQSGEWCGNWHACLKSADRHECDYDSDCTGDFVCHLNKCIQVECSYRTDPRCAPYTCADYTCGKTCTMQEDCAVGAACVQGACEVVVKECRGTSTSCAVHASSSACSANPSCKWGVASTWCSGTRRGCSGYFPSYCTTQAGCSIGYQYSCIGEPTPCEDLSDASCGQQDGCSLNSSSSCTGTPPSCASLADQTKCEAQPGCGWR